MDDEMVTLHNVMPVDLALKREMEYRHKMEALKNQQLNNLNPLLPSQSHVTSNPFPPSQVHPTSQTILKRKEPSTSGIKPKKPTIGLVCKICQITLCTVTQVKDHANSGRHKYNIQQLQKRGENVATPFLCEICHASCSSGIVMAAHLRGTKHAAVLKEVEKAKRARPKEGFAPRSSKDNFTQSYLKKPLNHLPQHLYTSKLITSLYLIEVLLAFVFFYPNYKKDDTNILKQSLSKCLAQYYPLAGRIPSPPEPYINCNDEGVEFLEAFNDSPLDDFIHKNVQDEFIDQLFSYGLTCTPQASSPLLLKVQLNHFSGGGAAVALSMSHKFADGATIANFVNHWATVARCGSPINPCFISSSKTDNTRMPDFNVNDLDKGNYVTRRFVFPNSKLQELKTKVIAMGTAPINPTRVEVVTSLLFKHAVSAATTSSGSLKPSNLTITVNMRNKFVENYPETAAGNLSMYGVAKMDDSGKIKLGEVIARIRKAKMELEGIKDEQELVQKFANAISNLQGDLYYITSVCRVPFYQVDFGWGKPVEVIIRFPNVGKNVIVLMDTASGDGIMANVQLPEEEMVILQKDKQFLTYVKDV